MSARIGSALSHGKSSDFEPAAVFYLRALGLDADNPGIYESLERTYRALSRDEDLVDIYRDRTYRDRRNPVLFRRYLRTRRMILSRVDSRSVSNATLTVPSSSEMRVTRLLIVSRSAFSGRNMMRRLWFSFRPSPD